MDAVKSGILTGANSLPVKQKFSILAESNRPPSKQSVFDRLIFPKDAWGSRAAPPDRLFSGRAQNSVRRNLVSREKPGNNGCGKAIDSAQMDLNLALDLGMSQPPSAFHPNPNLSWTGSSKSCSRCLSNNHSRSGCKFKIRCYRCLYEGHIAMNCIEQQHLDRNLFRINQRCDWSIKGKAQLEQPKWFSKTRSVPLRLSASSPPIFRSFADWWSVGLALQTAPQQPEPRIIPWTLPSKYMNASPDAFETHRKEDATQIKRDVVQSQWLEKIHVQQETPEQGIIDFFGLGQQVVGIEVEEQQNNEWHEELSAALSLNLNMVPLVLEQDLNAAPLPDDPQVVLFHPLHSMAQDNIDLNETEANIQHPVQLEVAEEVVEENHPIIESQASRVTS